MTQIVGLPWALFQPDGPRTVQHVVPMDDDKMHLLNKDCWCKPTLDEDCFAYVHNSADGREAYEVGKRKFN